MTDTSASDNPPAGPIGLVGDGMIRIGPTIVAVELLCVVAINQLQTRE